MLGLSRSDLAHGQQTWPEEVPEFVEDVSPDLGDQDAAEDSAPADADESPDPAGEPDATEPPSETAEEVEGAMPTTDTPDSGEGAGADTGDVDLEMQTDPEPLPCFTDEGEPRQEGEADGAVEPDSGDCPSSPPLPY